MKAGAMASVLVVAIMFMLDGWLASAMPTYPLAIRKSRQASGSPFGNTTNLALADDSWSDIQLLQSSPAVISLLGQLMILSTKKDFSLIDSAPRDGFKYMRHPESFAASLVQVSNDAYDAFMKAHENMDKIQLYMQKIPIQVKTAIDILAQGSPVLGKALLPSTFKLIEDIGQNCVGFANETHASFSNVMLLIGELLEVSTSAQGKYKEKLEDVKIELNQTEAAKQQLEVYGQQLAQYKAELDAKVARLQKQFDDAYNSIPTGWKVIGMKFVSGLADVAVEALRAGVQYMSGRMLSPDPAGKGGSSGGSTGDAGLIEVIALRSEDGPMAGMNLQLSYATLQKVYDGISGIADEVMNMLQDDKSEEDVSNKIHIFGVTLDGFTNMLNEVTSAITETATEYIDKAKSIISDVEDAMKGAKPIAEEVKKKIKEGFADLLKSMKPLLAKGAKNGAGGGGGGGGSSGSGGCRGDEIGCNEKFKAQESLTELMHEEDLRDKTFDRTLEYNEKMADFMGKLARLNMEEIDFEEIIKLLKDGILLLSQIKEQWSKLLRFFTAISSRTSLLTSTTLQPFLTFAQETETIEESGQKMDLRFLFKSMEDQANEINQDAYYVYTFSSTYVEVSSKYLVDRLAGLSQLMAAEDDQEREKLIKELNTNNNQTQDAIKALAQQKRDGYAQLVSARKKELDDIINKLGGPDPNDQKIIDDAYGDQKLLN